MSKHIDLIAVGALLLAFAFSTRVHDAIQLGQGQMRFARIRSLTPVVITPHLPSMPRIPRLHFPRV